MKNYSSIITNTPQTIPILGRTDMVKNNAGGYVFKIKPQDLLNRFLIIGSEGGTYYVHEQKLTIENAEGIIEYIKQDGLAVLKTVADVITKSKAPKIDASLFVLALLVKYGNEGTRKATYDQLPKLFRTSTHLFQFLASVKVLKGWSRGLRRAVSNFYLQMESDKLAYQLVKYRNRAGYTHRDVLRLSHPSTKDKEKNELFKYALGKTKETFSSLIQGFEAAQTTEDVRTLVNLIDKHKLTWEMVPTTMLKDANVLEALIPNMPPVALMRNLNKFTVAGLFAAGDYQTVSEKLLKEGHYLHPFNILNAMMTYGRGYGDKGSLTWTPNQTIVDTLDKLYYKSIENLKPTNKRILVAVDISVSMSASVQNSSLSAKSVAACMAMTILRSEPNAELVWFDTKIHAPTVGRRSSLEEIVSKTPNGGGTDCSLALTYALNLNKKYDAIIILTDNETWVGKHSVILLDNYRKKVNSDVKVIEIASASNGFSNYPTDDTNLLRVAGFDASVPDVINEFLK